MVAVPPFWMQAVSAVPGGAVPDPLTKLQFAGVDQRAGFPVPPSQL